MKNKNIKHIIVLINLLALQTGISQNFEWAKAYSGSSFQEGVSIATDAMGNVYTTGAFYHTVDFDPSESSTFNLTALGTHANTFITKLDADGNFIWAKSFEGLGDNRPNSIILDSSNNIYTVGYFNGTVDFQPNSGVFNLSSPSNSDVYISKLDANGNFIAAIRIGASDEDRGYAICLDTSNNMYVTGSFNGTVDFDPGSGIQNLTSTGTYSDIFILKLNSSGDFIWVEKITGTEFNLPNAMKIDQMGNIYIIGYFGGIIDLNFESGVDSHSSLGSDDVFVLKLNTSGDFIWGKTFGGISIDHATDLGFDSSRNIYTTGYFSDTVDFDPGTGTFNISALGSIRYVDTFISKLDTNGNFLGALSIGGVNSVLGYNINIDSDENVYISGEFSGTVDFNHGIDTYNITSEGDKDIFISKLNTNGDFINVFTMGGTSADQVNDSTIDDLGNIYTTGSFEGTIDFNSDLGNDFFLTSLGIEDAYTHKINGSMTLNTQDYMFVKSLTAFPNPTQKSTTINLGKLYNAIMLNVRTVTGQLIFTKNYKKTDHIDFNINGNSGLYFAEILADDKKATLKIVKQ